MRKVLITGIAGFAGSHLTERLHKKAQVWGTYIDANLSNISAIPDLNLIKCELLDYTSVLEAVSRIKPDCIFHLAAQSAPSLSYANPEGTLKTNIFSTLNLFEAVLAGSPNSTILNIGSGDEYGEVDSVQLPVKESTELKPLNPYAVSKVTTDLMSFQYSKTRNLKVVRCRPFNHIGPRQSDNFVAASFAKQIAEIEAGIKQEKVLKVGNLESSRDFIDVRDVVAAYELLMDKGEYGEVYNICSGRAIKIQEILDTLLSFSKKNIEVIQDIERLRSKESPVVYGDAMKMQSLGWAPKYTLRESLRELLEYWRERVKG
ncbi:MAG: GDP-mannose 4,6-dehydratase [Deltaproteobacteria bacterium]|nr:GDP-mannose 4,6-dehydratase [Deltaproteobacteria bacterium]